MKPLGTLLVERHCVDNDTIESALKICSDRGIRLGECLISEFGVTEQSIYETMAEQFSIPFIEKIEHRVNEDLLKNMPVELFNEGRCFPLEEDNGTLSIVVADPMDLDIILDIEFATGMIIVTNMTTGSEMENMWRKLFTIDSILSSTSLPATNLPSP